MYLSFLNKVTFANLQKIEDWFGQGCNSDGEPGPFCDVESFGVTQDFYEGAIPDIDPLGVGENSAGDEGNESVAV